MQARFVSAASDGDQWELTSSRGCCSFAAQVIEGHTLVELVKGCHECVNELNVLALERGWRVIRRPPEE